MDDDTELEPEEADDSGADEDKRQAALDKWARDYYETEGGIDQFNPEDR